MEIFIANIKKHPTDPLSHRVMGIYYSSIAGNEKIGTEEMIKFCMEAEKVSKAGDLFYNWFYGWEESMIKNEKTI